MKKQAGFFLYIGMVTFTGHRHDASSAVELDRRAPCSFVADLMGEKGLRLGDDDALVSKTLVDLGAAAAAIAQKDLAIAFGAGRRVRTKTLSVNTAA